MPLEGRDASYLWDMIDAARTMRKFAEGVKLADYLADEKLRLAVERAIEIIGEAARRLSPSFRNEHPEIPWARIIAQRNVLIHEYDEVGNSSLPARTFTWPQSL